MEKYHHLTQKERDRIQALLDAGHRQKEIARILGRNKGTISREIKRNRRRVRSKEGTRDGPYLANLAQTKADNRERKRRYRWKKINVNDRLKEYVIESLKRFWSPDGISGRLKTEGQPFYASKTAIYDWLFSSWGQRYCPYLYSQRYRPRKRKGKKVGKTLIPNRVSVHLRPEIANQELGHWEADTVVSGRKTGGQSALTVLFERQSKYTDFVRIPNLKPGLNARAQKEMMKKITAVKSLTLDNGLENREHQSLNVPTFFCDPYCSWQKAGIENANKLIRWFVPKGTDIGQYPQEYLEQVKEILNSKPRKSLNYQTPLEIMIKNNLLKVPFSSLEIKTPEVALRG